MIKYINNILSNLDINKIFPFLLWFGELRNFKTLKSDLIAGTTVAMILVPQSMVYAKLAELPLEIGLYTAFIPVMLAGLFGSSRQMSTGPVTIISIMTATALSSIAISGTEGYIIYASILALFIGIFYLILGIIKGGIIVEFLSHPVIIGFTNAVALITIFSQLPKLFGVDKPTTYSNYGDYVYQIIQNIISSTHLLTITIGLLSIGFLILFNKIFPKLPKILLLLIISITSVSLLNNFYSIEGLNIIKDIKGGFPDFSLPIIQESVFTGTFGENLIIIKHLALYAIIIGLIGFTGSISVAKFVGAKTKQKVSANNELISQGISNIGSSLFGGMGVAGSFSKTAINLKAGAKTGFSSIVTGIIVGITIMFLLDFLYYLPIATLSAIIIVSVFDLIKFQPIINGWKIEKHDGIVGMVTFLLTLFFTPKIELGILFGVVLSLLFFIYRSMRPKFVEVGMFKDGLYRDIEKFGLQTSKHISVFRFGSALYFANSGYFESQILEHIAKKKNIKYIVIDMEWISDIDSSGLEMFKRLIYELKESDIKIYLTSIRVKVFYKLYKVGFIKKFGKKNIFITIQDSINFIEKNNGKKIKTKNLEEYTPEKKSNKNKKLEKFIINKYMDK